MGCDCDVGSRAVMVGVVVVVAVDDDDDVVVVAVVLSVPVDRPDRVSLGIAPVLQLPGITAGAAAGAAVALLPASIRDVSSSTTTPSSESLIVEEEDSDCDLETCCSGCCCCCARCCWRATRCRTSLLSGFSSTVLRVVALVTLEGALAPAPAPGDVGSLVVLIVTAVVAVVGLAICCCSL